MSATTTERRKRGEPHPSGNGLVFFAYRSASEGGGEYWVSPEQLEKDRRRAQERMARSRVENPEKTRELHLAWRTANLEKFKENQARWKVANKERVKEYDARWRAANPEKHIAAVKRWSAENTERHRAAARRWRAANPDACRAQRAQRRAMKRNASHPLHSAEIETVLFQSAARLRECLGIDFHVDHVTPLSRGGMHHHTNMRVLPGRLNVIKQDRLDSELTDQLQTAIKQWSPFLN